MILITLLLINRLKKNKKIIKNLYFSKENKNNKMLKILLNNKR